MDQRLPRWHHHRRQLRKPLRESPEHLEALAAAAQLDEMVRDSLTHADQVDLLADDAQSTEVKSAAVETVDEFDITEAASTDSTHTGVLALLSKLEPSDDDIELVDLTQTLRDRELAKQQRRAAEQRRLQPESEDEHRTRVIIIPKLVAVLGAAALVGLVVWIGVVASQSSPTQPTAENTDPETNMRIQTPPANVAFVRSSVDAQWTGRGASYPYLRGDAAVTLTAGYAEVVFGNGAGVIVQAPATFEPTGPNAMSLVAGSITATCPESAAGFTVATANGLITDYGTEFGVNVNPAGQMRAQTFSGRIGLTPLGSEEEIDLVAGDAVVADTRGRVRPVEMDELAFVRDEEFAARRDAEDSAYARWLAYSYELRRDPSLVAMYLFDEADERTGQLLNHAIAAGDTLGGELVGAGTPPTWTPGRLPGKRSLRFDASQQQRVVFDDWPAYAPDQAITVSVWFRADPTREDWNVILSQWGGDDPGPDSRFHMGVLGQVEDGDIPPADRRICLHVQSEGEFKHKDQSRGGGSIVREAGWVHAAFTITAQGEARLYINGREVDRTRLDVPERSLAGSNLPLVLGGKAEGDKFFDGEIDELIILGRAMTPDEVAHLYHAGSSEPLARP